MSPEEAYAQGRKHGQDGKTKTAGMSLEAGLARDRWFQGYEHGYQERWSEVVVIPAKAPMPSAASAN